VEDMEVIAIRTVLQARNTSQSLETPCNLWKHLAIFGNTSQSLETPRNLWENLANLSLFEPLGAPKVSTNYNTLVYVVNYNSWCT
jgi:hypothetical protein